MHGMPHAASSHVSLGGARDTRWRDGGSEEGAPGRVRSASSSLPTSAPAPCFPWCKAKRGADPLGGKWLSGSERATEQGTFAKIGTPPDQHQAHPTLPTGAHDLCTRLHRQNVRPVTRATGERGSGAPNEKRQRAQWAKLENRSGKKREARWRQAPLRHIVPNRGRGCACVAACRLRPCRPRRRRGWRGQACGAGQRLRSWSGS